jgi:hypothetical protein
MTPKEKATELADKYFNVGDQEFDYSKEFALIAVDEIINSNPHSNPLNTNVESTMCFWQEVKKEIEAL